MEDSGPDLSGPPLKKLRIDCPDPIALDSEAALDDMDGLYETTPPPRQSPGARTGVMLQTDLAGVVRNESEVPKTPSVIPGLGLLSEANQTATLGSGQDESNEDQSRGNGCDDTDVLQHEESSTLVTPPDTATTNGQNHLLNGGTEEYNEVTSVEVEIPGETPASLAVPDPGAECPQPESITGMEQAEWEADSSVESSDSSSESSSSQDEDDEDYELLDPEEQARILMQDGGSDDEGDISKAGKPGGSSHVKTKNEIQEDKVERPDVTVTSDMAIEELGTVETLVDNLVVIKAKTTGEYQVLETGSVLCLDDRSVIGAVTETLGRVQQPYYSVRFNSRDEIVAAGISAASKIFYVPQHSTYVFTQALKAIKGSDASNLHDEEVGVEEMEFSDDEAEAEYKRRIKQDRSAKRGGRGAAQGQTSRRQQHAPAVRNSPYGDNSGTSDVKDDGEPYTPLSRPSNYHELMMQGGAHPVAQVPHIQSSGHPRGGRNRGRGARGARGGGSFRGRGLHQYHDAHNKQDHGGDDFDEQYYPQRPGLYPIDSGSLHGQHQQPPTPSNMPHTYVPQTISPSFPQQSPQLQQFPPQTPYGWGQFSPPPVLPFVPTPLQAAAPPTPGPGGILPAGAFVNPAFFRSPRSTPMRNHNSPPPQQQHLAPNTIYPGAGLPFAPAADPEATAMRVAQEQLGMLRNLGRPGS